MRSVSGRTRTVIASITAATFLAACSKQPDTITSADWPSSGGDPEHQRYSSLDQINRDNVGELEVAWVYRTGGLEADFAKMHTEPLAIDGVLYVISPQFELAAINAATGHEQWRFTPYRDGEQPLYGLNRGLAAWSGDGERRLYYSAGSFLYAVDATTGTSVETFGDKGRIDLREGLGRDSKRISVSSPAPGAVFENLIIMGSAVGEGPGSAPGHIRAYDVSTGEIRWTFHTIPHPGEFGYETWAPDSWKLNGGTNAWSGLSLDTEAGVVYVPTGSASFDYYGANRPGNNLFANSLIALDARTGERRWHFQTVHHDLWDSDLPTSPSLITIERDGKAVDVAVQPTKRGYLFVFDRKTGEPVFPVEEVPVAQGNIPGEWYSPTQPFPSAPPPFTRQVITEENLIDFTPELHEEALEILRSVRYEGPFTPAGTDTSYMMPGLAGGANWGGASYDPETGLLYINAIEEAALLQLIPIGGAMHDRGEQLYLQHCAGCHGVDRKGGAEDMPPLDNISERYASGSLVTAELIIRGRGRMPGFAHLEFRDIFMIIEYLFDGGESDAVVPDSVLVGEGAARDAAIEEQSFVLTGFDALTTKDDIPINAPPWGTLTAIDMEAAEIRWRIPFGEYPHLAEKGFRNTGSDSRGGGVVTAGGLLFIAATPDEKMHAYDKATGELLWEDRLPTAGFASTVTYMAAGRQFIVIAAGGGTMGRPPGDYYVAYALPEGS